MMQVGPGLLIGPPPGWSYCFALSAVQYRYEDRLTNKSAKSKKE